MGAVTSAEQELPAGRDCKIAFRRWHIVDVKAAYYDSLQVLAERHARSKALKNMHVDSDGVGTAATIEKARKTQRELAQRLSTLDPTLPRVATLANPPPKRHEPTNEEKIVDKAMSHLKIQPYSSLFGVTVSFSDFFDVFGPGSKLMMSKMLSLPLDVYKLFDKDHKGQVICLELFIALALYSEGELLDRIAFCFEAFDEDGNNSLDPEEMMVLVSAGISALYHLGDLPAIPPDDVLTLVAEEMFKVADADGSGDIDPEEFTEWAQRSHHSADLIAKFDATQAKIRRMKDGKPRAIVWRSVRAAHPLSWGGNVADEEDGMDFDKMGDSKVHFEQLGESLKTMNRRIRRAERIAPGDLDRARVARSKLKAAALVLGKLRSVANPFGLPLVGAAEPLPPLPEPPAMPFLDTMTPADERRAMRKAASSLGITLVPNKFSQDDDEDASVMSSARPHSASSPPAAPVVVDGSDGDSDATDMPERGRQRSTSSPERMGLALPAPVTTWGSPQPQGPQLAAARRAKAEERLRAEREARQKQLADSRAAKEAALRKQRWAPKKKTSLETQIRERNQMEPAQGLRRPTSPLNNSLVPLADVRPMPFVGRPVSPTIYAASVTNLLDVAAMAHSSAEDATAPPDLFSPMSMPRSVQDGYGGGGVKSRASRFMFFPSNAQPKPNPSHHSRVVAEQAALMASATAPLQYVSPSSSTYDIMTMSSLESGSIDSDAAKWLPPSFAAPIAPAAPEDMASAWDSYLSGGVSAAVSFADQSIAAGSTMPLSPGGAGRRLQPFSPGSSATLSPSVVHGGVDGAAAAEDAMVHPQPSTLVRSLYPSPEPAAAQREHLDSLMKTKFGDKLSPPAKPRRARKVPGGLRSPPSLKPVSSHKRLAMMI